MSGRPRPVRTPLGGLPSRFCFLHGWGCLSLAYQLSNVLTCNLLTRFGPISFPLIHLKLYLDRDGTYVVTYSLIVSHRPAHSLLHPHSSVSVPTHATSNRELLTSFSSTFQHSNLPTCQRVLIYLLSFDTLAHSFSQRRLSILCVFSLLRTLSIATGVYTPISPNRGT